jgi:hypothetical protein
MTECGIKDGISDGIMEDCGVLEEDDTPAASLVLGRNEGIEDDGTEDGTKDGTEDGTEDGTKDGAAKNSLDSTKNSLD